LVVKDVTVAFGGVKALDSVTLEVRPGTVHGLIGPNGAGKTTLIDAVTGFVTTKPGSTILLGDTDVAGWSARRRAQLGLARSFQTLELFSDLTVEENLAIAEDHSGYGRLLTDLVVPRRIKLGDASREALHQFGLTDLLDARPSDVSFGQRKLIAISRAIAAAPSALLLDEPAAGLDDKEAEALVGVIRYLADVWGMAILLVEHNLNVVMAASDELSVLNEGRLLASGQPDEIRRDQGVIDAYLGVG
jgi:sulfate-transporting ATPase